MLVEEKPEQTVQHLVQDSLSYQKIVKLPSVDLTQKHSNQTVFCHVVNPVQYAISQGLPQKKGVRPDVEKTEIKYVKGVSFVDHCLSAKSVPNVPNVVTELGVGGRLQKFWPKWETLGANPRVVSILREGYTLPFKMRPPLSRFPLITSGYANPARSLGRKVGGRKGSGADLPILLQPPVPGPKTRQVASNLGSQSTQSFSQN